jgi:hypothetical protein
MKRILTIILSPLIILGFILGVIFLSIFHPRRVREEDLIYEREDLL